MTKVLNENMKGYLASHFFDRFGFEGTEKLAGMIRKALPNLDLYVPQENDDINDKSKGVSDIEIYEADTKRLLDSDIVIAYLDGVEIDAGVATEIGVFAGYHAMLDKYTIQAKERLIIGLYTDMRRADPNNPMYKNLYSVGAIKKHGVVVFDIWELYFVLEIWNQYRRVASVQRHLLQRRQKEAEKKYAGEVKGFFILKDGEK